METVAPNPELLNFEIIDFSSAPSSELLWLGLLVVLGLFAIVSAILVYHWRTYALGGVVVRRMMALYFSVSAIFILLLIAILLSITL